ncbi:excisionase family DNA-binding protein [Streptomyces sp. NPDC021096]|uniref:excisionase family DNA-binding protein n=1 Tax=unclassified Streptomyces TaxID=2593676 RepID=UPI0033FB2030
MHRPALPPAPSDCLLSVAEAAERLGTGERFIRRLIAERRIAFVKVGRHVRIADSVLAAYIEANTVEPARRIRSRYGKAA